MEISEPGSTAYGQFWDSDTVVNAFQPSQSTVEVTTKWLVDAGIHPSRIKHTKNRGFIAFDATTSELENLLDAQYHTYVHLEKGHEAVACERYHVPAHLKRHIDYVTPGSGFRSLTKKALPTKNIEKRSSNCTTGSKFSPELIAEKGLTSNLSACAEFVTPACVRALYGIPEATHPHPNNSFGIYELDVSPLQNDMDIYFKYVATNIPQGTQPVNDFINGANITTSINQVNRITVLEADIDFQVAWSLVYPLNLTFFNANGTAAQFEELASVANNSDALNTVGNLELIGDTFSSFDGSFCTETPGSQCATFTAPNVLSLSCPGDEIDVTPAASQRLCLEFLKLGLQGTTVIFASGDSGVQDAGGQPGTCIGPNNSTFNPNLFSSCPWVTSVGATQIPTNGTVYDPEIAALDTSTPSVPFSSGGGFSNYYSAPEYQTAALAEYFSAHPPPYPYYTLNITNQTAIPPLPPTGRYNRPGRGYPDVSANGLNTLTIYDGCAQPIWGTSISAPVFASVIALINNERLWAGKGPVGFINPALYAHPQVLNDIVAGNSLGCGTQGFGAVGGWDPVTGLGTPRFGELLEMFLGLP